MKKAFALTGVAAAATLTIGGLVAALPEPAMASQRRRHHLPAPVRAQRHFRHHHRQNRGASQVLRYQNVVNGPGWGAVFGPGYGGGRGGLMIRF